MTRRIGVVSVIVTDRTTQAGKVHDVISEFGDIVIGRMGVPAGPEASTASPWLSTARPTRRGR